MCHINTMYFSYTELFNIIYVT